jgi:autotransporter family porin
MSSSRHEPERAAARTRRRIGVSLLLLTALAVTACGGDNQIQFDVPAPVTASSVAADTSATPASTSTAPNAIDAEHFGTLPPGSALPSDAECAARVRPTPEVRPQNVSFNQTKGHGPPADPPAPVYSRVTGSFTGTTDEILQWAACKWGIDEDIVRAQAAKESYWTQTNVGDNGESFGILQVRQPYMGWAFNDGAGDAKSSTSYNVDMSLAARRNCFEGNETWLNTPDRGRDYSAGDIWGCVGMWFSGRWYTPDSITYIKAVQDYMNERIWTTRDFLNFR